MTQSDTDILVADLTNRLNVANQDADALRVRWNQVSNLRLVIAALAIGLGFWWIRTDERVWGVLAFATLLVFIAILVWHHKLRGRRDRTYALVTVREQAIRRVHRQWADLPLPRENAIAPEHPFAFDLDLIGRGSLLHLMDTTQTPAGNATIRHWLLSGSGTAEIAERQEIAQDIEPNRDWREDLHAAGLNSASERGNPEAMLTWLETTARSRIGVHHVVAIVSALVTVSVMVLVVFGVVGSGLIFPLVVLNGLISFSAPVRGRLGELSTHARALRQYRITLPIVEAIPGNSVGTLAIRAETTNHGKNASQQLASLDRALSLVVPRSSMVWFVLQLAINWDLLVDARLIRVTREIGPHVRRWVELIGRVESIAALAGLADLNPGWTWPTLATPGTSLKGVGLGHPLLPSDRRVSNDVELGPPGQVLIVTGSNMAGKSTLLRAIGLNAVLARAGGPVCAESLILPNQPVWSSVRIQDSLEQGVSLYMAELLRLKSIVDAAQTQPITYLLDEILHGTNTTERRIAARIVIGKLLRTASIGTVSTHDLELVDEELGAHATCVHLVDQVRDTGSGPEMTFDYKVRPGLAPTSNALRLLELVGLGEQPKS